MMRGEEENRTVSLLAELFLRSEMRRAGTAQFNPSLIFDFVDIMGEHLIVSSAVG